MAADDNVIRLKNIKSLARIIADITLQGGGGDSAVVPHDADFALYVPDSTSIIVTGKQQPALSLGGWSIADTVYTAAINYDGDGTLSTDVGTITNGTLTVNDADGTFSGVISASSGNHFAASKLYFGNTVQTVGGGGGKPIPSLTVGNWDRFTAPITYTGDGALGVIGGSLSSTLLTAGDQSGIIYARETYNYAAAITDWQWSNDTLLVAYLPFTTSTTGDLCGGNWVAYGNPVIQDGALYLDGSSYLSLDDGLTLGGQDFTIDFWYKWGQTIVDSSPCSFGTGGWSSVWINLYPSGTLYAVALYAWNANAKGSSEKYSFADWRHFALVYQHAKPMTTCYLDGVQLAVEGRTIPATTAPFVIGAFYDKGRCANGSIKNFRIFNGVALWTEDFTPPAMSA